MAKTRPAICPLAYAPEPLTQRPEISFDTSSAPPQRTPIPPKMRLRRIPPSFGVWLLPNGSRLSCGADLEGSQTEFYHTVSLESFGTVGGWRRQLQALVRRQRDEPQRTARLSHHRR